MTALEPPTSNLQPPIHALSTMWSQGRFPDRDHPDGRDSMERFAEAASRLGYPAVEINYVIPPDGFEELISTNHVSIVSLHSPTPRLKDGNGRWSESLNLAALDEEERLRAVRLAHATIDQALRAGARYVVVHLGGIESGGENRMFDGERRLRRLFDSGVRPDGRPSGRDGEE